MVSKDQRRRQLAREKFERQQQRRAEQRRKARVRNAAIAAAVAVVVALGATAYAVGGLGGGDAKGDSAAPSPSASSKAPDPCAKPAPGEPSGRTWDKEPAMTIDTAAAHTMKLKTTCGDIDLALQADKAPHTVNSFAFLAGQGYFDHTKCHRLTTSGIYVLQCGDPKGTGMGDPGYKLKDENLKDERLKGGVYPAGTVAMANAGPNTGGSQFFLVYQDSPLPANYTPFGTVSEAGMAVLKKIAAAGESGGAGDGAPNATVVIDKATVTAS
ncbi:peptidylprolyl isomerase [Streptomyces sp. URMC 123]|uniref:peptidylprolyl isomerase n=1 Tax=Streptomyces sp. URMC 123 TaxID=3423403 RepID=UPI003F1DB63F